MRLPLLRVAVLASTLAMPVAACADTIDDFSFTGDSHTISYSLPATDTFAALSPPLISEFNESAPTTIDGVSGYSVSGAYYLPGYSDRLLLYLPSSIFGSSPVGFSGPSFFDYTEQGSLITATFVPGTYSLIAASSNGIIPYTLIITQEAGAAPEPSTWALLATGMFSLIGMAVNRRSRSAKPGTRLAAQT